MFTQMFKGQEHWPFLYLPQITAMYMGMHKRSHLKTVIPRMIVTCFAVIFEEATGLQSGIPTFWGYIIFNKTFSYCHLLNRQIWKNLLNMTTANLKTTIIWQQKLWDRVALGPFLFFRNGHNWIRPIRGRPYLKKFIFVMVTLKTAFLRHSNLLGNFNSRTPLWATVL